MMNSTNTLEAIETKKAELQELQDVYEKQHVILMTTFERLIQLADELSTLVVQESTQIST